MDYTKLVESLRNEGGFSVSMAGKSPRRGVMVSRTGSESTFDGVPSERDLEGYVRQHARALADPGRYLGGWVDDGKTYVDISDRWPEGTEAADNALNANQQLAGYDVGAGEAYDTPPQLFGPLPSDKGPNASPDRTQYRRRDQILTEGRARSQWRKMQQGLF